MKLKTRSCHYVIGIDEVGRGPLAGPVTVCAFCVPKGLTRAVLVTQNKGKDRQERRQGRPLSLKKLFKGARDSKKMSAKQREEVFKKIKEAPTQGFGRGADPNGVGLRYIVQNQSAKVIDVKGLSFAIRLCIKKCLGKLKKELKFKPEEVLVLLDGGLKAPEEFIHQKTIIRGDDKELVISLASICAKVTRDAYMRTLAKKYSVYGFERHVGYGTKYHREMIQKHGLTPIHRRSFLRNRA